MINPNTIIIGLFTIGGLIATLYGGFIIAKSRKIRHWRAAEGVVEESEPSSEQHDLMPKIVYRYTVGGETHKRTLEFPAGVTPTPELTAHYVRKYPVGTRVQVYYDPEQPVQATLDAGQRHDDWLVLAFGLAAFLFGIVAFIFTG